MNDNASYAGRTVGRYRLDQLIGRGAVGEVYRAFDERLLRPVAIKVSLPQAAGNLTHVSHMVREAQVIARLEHSSIVPIYDVLDHEQSALIVMRFIRGHNLGQVLQQSGEALVPGHALRLVYPAMLGMEYAHSKGVVHSDLKPENIFVSETDEVFVLDFGVAALLELERKKKGKIYGTPLYMPPEQFSGACLDARADIYSLGLLLYRMVTGCHPFAHASCLKELLEHQVGTVPNPPAAVDKNIPVEFSECIMRALEKEPRRRYYSCREFLVDMQKSLPESRLGDENAGDMRWDPRCTLELGAVVRLQNRHEPVYATITSMSVSGVSLLLASGPYAGESLEVSFELLEDDSYVSILTRATVMWVDKKSDMDKYEIGVSFADLSEADKQHIAYYVRNLLLA